MELDYSLVLTMLLLLACLVGLQASKVDEERSDWMTSIEAVSEAVESLDIGKRKW